MTIRRAVAVAMAAAGLVLGAWAPPVAAHASLETTVPAANAVLVESPPAIVLDFDEAVEIELATIDLFDGDGAQIELGEPAAGDDDTQVTASVPPLADGLYAVVWRVTSVDGHAVEGAFAFSIGNTSGGDGAALLERLGGGDDAALEWWYGVARFLSLAGAVVLVGGGWWAVARPLVLARRPRVRRLLLGASLATVVGSVAAFGLYAAEVRDGRLASALSPGAWGDALASDTGRLLLLRSVLSIVLLALTLAGSDELRRAGRWWRASAVVASIAIAVTFSAAGHANVGGARPLWVLVDLLHLAAVTAWVGGLVVLASAPASALADEDAVPVVRRFSAVAAVSVVVVVVTGVAQALQLAGGVDDLTATEWGRLLLVKVVLVAVLLAVAGVSRWLLRHDGTTSIRRTLVIEAVVGLLVVALAAAMVAQPPRPVPASQPFDESLVASGVIAGVAITPGRVGTNELHITVTPPGGSLVLVDDVTARVSLPAAGIPASPASLAPVGPNHYSGAVTFSQPGDWTIEVIVQISASETALLKATVPIP